MHRQIAVSLSRRAQEMPASPIRRLAPFAVAAQKAGKTVYGLNIGQPDIPTPREILERLRGFDARNVPYGPSQGLPEFIATLRTYYQRCGLDVATDEIFVTTGGSEAILFTLGAICDPGDEVLLFEPFYTNYNGFAAMMAVRAIAATTPRRGRLPPAVARGDRAPHRRAHPGASCCARRTTPPARCTPTPRWRWSATSAATAVCYLISDEVYREFAYDGRKQRRPSP